MLAKHSLNLQLSENIFISSLFLKDMFTRYKLVVASLSLSVLWRCFYNIAGSSRNVRADQGDGYEVAVTYTSFIGDTLAGLPVGPPSNTGEKKGNSYERREWRWSLCSEGMSLSSTGGVSGSECSQGQQQQLGILRAPVSRIVSRCWMQFHMGLQSKRPLMAKNKLV